MSGAETDASQGVDKGGELLAAGGSLDLILDPFRPTAPGLAPTRYV